MLVVVQPPLKITQHSIISPRAMLFVLTVSKCTVICASRPRHIVACHTRLNYVLHVLGLLSEICEQAAATVGQFAKVSLHTSPVTRKAIVEVPLVLFQRRISDGQMRCPC